MLRLPRSHTLLNRFKLIGSNARAHVLPIRYVLVLTWTLYRRGKIEPVISLNVTARHALAQCVKHAQRPLRARIALFGGLAIPRCCLIYIARKQLTAAIAIKTRKVKFCSYVALLCGFGVPINRLLIVVGCRAFIACLNLGRCVARIGPCQHCRIDLNSQTFGLCREIQTTTRK